MNIELRHEKKRSDILTLTTSLGTQNHTGSQITKSSPEPDTTYCTGIWTPAVCLEKHVQKRKRQRNA